MAAKRRCEGILPGATGATVAPPAHDTLRVRGSPAHMTPSVAPAWYGSPMLPLVILLGVAVFATPVSAQAARVTKVYAVAAAYSDIQPFKRGPERLRRILDRLRAYYAEGSGGTHELVAEVHPTVLDLGQARPAGRCQLPDRAALSTRLNEAGIVLDGQDALVLVVPPSAGGCPGGVKTGFVHRDAAGRARQLPLAIAWSLTERYIAHEILHTHGLGHANALACRGVALAAHCKLREYGNAWDLMGQDGGGYQMISAPMRARMEWTEPVLHASGRATYTIGAATRPGGLPTAVEVVLPFRGSDALHVRWPLSLWIEARAPFGSDQRLGRLRRVNFTTSAMVHLTGAWQVVTDTRRPPVTCPPTAPCLLDMTPETGGFGDAGLPVGRSWTDPFSGTQITVDARTETTLTITVTSP